MALTPVEPLARLAAHEWRALGERMRSIGFVPENVAKMDAIAPRVSGPPRDAILIWHLRQVREPWAYAMRLLAAGDAVTRDEARAALGEELLAKLASVGFVHEAQGRVRAGFYMLLVNGFYLVFDELSAGEDSAMGFGSTTLELWRAAHPHGRVGAVLDLGCGAGACTFALSTQAERVVGTDINARAVEIGRLNVAINGTTNVEFRVGDLFAPVAGETFDLVVSQPPFVARPDGAEERTYLFGGARGDELALRLLGGVRAHLTPRGRAIILVEFPEIDGDPIVERVRAAVGQDGVRALLVRSEHGIDGACVSYGLMEHPALGEPYVRAVQAWRTHFERVGVRGHQLTFAVIERTGDGPSWVEATPIRFHEGECLSAARIDALVAAHDLVARGPQAIFDARLRVPEKTRFVRAPDAAPGEEILVESPRSLLVEASSLSEDAYDLVARVAEADSAGAAIAAMAAAQGATVDEAREVLIPALDELLRRSVLEVA